MGCTHSSPLELEGQADPAGGEEGGVKLNPNSAFMQGLFEKTGTPREISAGETFIKQDALGSSAFFIRQGKVELRLSGANGEQTLASRGAGDILGDLSLLLGLPYTVSAVAKTAVSVIEVQHVQLMAQLREEPAQAGRLFKALATVLAERISELSGAMRSTVTSAAPAANRSKQHSMGTTDIAKMRSVFGLDREEKLIGVYKCSVARELNAQKEDQLVGELYIFEVLPLFPPIHSPECRDSHSLCEVRTPLTSGRFDASEAFGLRPQDVRIP